MVRYGHGLVNSGDFLWLGITTVVHMFATEQQMDKSCRSCWGVKPDNCDPPTCAHPHLHMPPVRHPPTLLPTTSALQMAPPDGARLSESH